MDPYLERHWHGAHPALVNNTADAPQPQRDDSDIVLDGQGVLEEEYRNGAFGRIINYAGPANSPLTGDAAVWADERLRKAGRRAAVT